MHYETYLTFMAFRTFELARLIGNDTHETAALDEAAGESEAALLSAGGS